jgi:hypothetical protein
VDALLEILSFNEQSTFDTSALFGWIKRDLSPYEAEVSKVDYPSKTKSSSDVRGVGTIFDAFLNLGHSFSYKFKNSCMSNTVWDFLISFFGIRVNFL